MNIWKSYPIGLEEARKTNEYLYLSNCSRSLRDFDVNRKNE